MKPELPGGLTELSDRVRRRIVDLARAQEPSTTAVLLAGSYARGAGTPQSDVDIDVMTRGDPSGACRSWLERDGGRLLHVSADAMTVEKWMKEAERPANWSLGFPVVEAGTFLWADDETRTILGDPPVIRRPPGTPELEDFLEFAMKIERAAFLRDGRALRWWAQDLGRYAPPLLRPLNPETVVADPLEAVDAALGFPAAPEHWSEDLTLCLGLTSATDSAVEAAARRLPLELLAFLRTHPSRTDAEHDFGRYLTDGTLEQYLAGPHR
ncbi:MAG: nucleotidyltransferase domain-containing protein [Actinomycetota bacterium]|jgi:phosphoribosyl-AMP cyclohydrolase|nr:nucleotidyltransferase domain-containing protein [Actinomycetota bacterium]